MENKNNVQKFKQHCTKMLQISMTAKISKPNNF